MGTGLLLLLLAGAGGGPATDFGVRLVGETAPPRIEVSPKPAVRRSAFSLAAAVTIAARFGRVTSTHRSLQHNRRVGGVPNSWHLHGRAIDIARSPSVSHAALAAEFRRRGFHLIESLDEGDHSHFAFGDGSGGPRARSSAEQLAEVKGEADYFRFIEVPRARRSSLR